VPAPAGEAGFASDCSPTPKGAHQTPLLSLEGSKAALIGHVREEGSRERESTREQGGGACSSTLEPDYSYPVSSSYVSTQKLLPKLSQAFRMPSGDEVFPSLPSTELQREGLRWWKYPGLRNVGTRHQLRCRLCTRKQFLLRLEAFHSNKPKEESQAACPWRRK
jgi:hypothetical protein